MLVAGVVVAAILFVVLAKPEWLIAGAVTTFFSPGALGDMLGDVTAWWK